jgi:hypothetical protein
LQDKAIKPIERFLIGLDSWPWSAVYRVGLGMALPLLFDTLFGGYQVTWWGLPAFFVAVLIALRVVPALMRFALPFSAEAKGIWAQRRGLAKRYDSYQWQKLFWIGLGLLCHLFFAGAARIDEVALVIFCLVGGGLGLVMWHKAGGLRAAAR